ncbi:unnamed protein product [Sphagnum troendelagicum]
MDNPSTHGSRRKSDDLPLRSVGPVDDLQVCQRAMPNVNATRPFTSPERSVGLVNRQCLPRPEKLPARKRESTFEGDEVFTTARQSTRSSPPSSRSRSLGSFRSPVNVGSSHCGSGVPRVGPADQANDDLPTATRELISIRACSHRSRSCSHASLRNAANVRSSADGSRVRGSPADDDVKLRRNSVKKVAEALPSAGREKKVSNIPRPSKTSLSPTANHQAGSSCAEGGGRYSQANPQREAIVQRSRSHRNPEVGTDPMKPIVTRVEGRPSAAGQERVVDKGKGVKRYSSPAPPPPPEEHHVDKQGVMRFAGRPSGAGPETIVDKGHQRLASCPSSIAAPERFVDKGKVMGSFRTPPPPKRRYVDKQDVMHSVGSHRPSPTAGGPAEKNLDQGKVKRYLLPSEKQPYVDKEEEEEEPKGPDFIDNSELPTGAIRKDERSCSHGKIRSPSQQARITFAKASNAGFGNPCPSQACDPLQSFGKLSASNSCYGSRLTLQPNLKRPATNMESPEDDGGLHDHMQGTDDADDERDRARDCCVENKISTVARVPVLNTSTILPSSKSGGPASNVIPDQASCTRNPAGYLSTITRSTLATIPPKKRWGLLQAFDATTTTTGQSEL